MTTLRTNSLDLKSKILDRFPSAVEMVSERQENGKKFSLGNGKISYDLVAGIVHYKENYDDENEAWKEIDLTPIDNGDHFLIDKSTSIVRIYKNKLGYEVESRRSGHIMSVELDTTKPDINDVDFELEIFPGKVRLWKIIKHSEAIKKLKWKVTEQNKAMGLYSLKFRELPEAYDDNNNMPELTHTKTVIDKDSYYWEETFTGKAHKIENDGHTIGDEVTPVYPIKIDVDVDEDVGATADTCYWIDDPDDYFTTPTDRFNAGTYSASYDGYGSAARFTTVNVAQGQVIDTADIAAYCSQSFSGTNVLTQIRATNEDNTSNFSGLTYTTFHARAKTTAKVDWDITASWSVGTQYTSPEIKTVVQEVFDRSGWSANNALAILWYNDGSSTAADNLRRCAHYNHSTYDPPHLHMEYTADININHTKISVDATPKTHSVAIDEIVNQTKKSIDATPKSHSIAIDEIINQVTKSVEVTPKTHSVLIDEAILQTKQAVQASPKSHTVLLDQAISQTKQTVDVTPKSHSVAIDLLIPQTKQSVDITPKSHSISIDEAIVQSKQSVDVTPKTHAIAIDEIVNHVKQTIEATAKTHVVLLDIAISQTKQAIQASPKSHSVAIDLLINQVKQSIEAAAKSHTVTIAEVVYQTKQAIESTAKTHGIAIDLLINQVKQSVEATAKSHGIAIDLLIPQSKQTVNITPKTHTVLIDVAHTQTKQSVDVTAKSHKIAIDLLINQIKQAIQATAKSHSILIDEAVSQVKQRIEADPKTHTIQITADVNINQTKQAVEVTSKSHSILIDEAIKQIKKTIEVSPKSHTITIDEAISQTKQSIEASPKSHTVRLDEAFSQSKQTVDVTGKTHSVAIDELINQINQTIEITPKTHTIAIDEIINQIAKSINVTGKTHSVQIDEIISQVKAAIAVTAKTHRVAIDEVIYQACTPPIRSYGADAWKFSNWQLTGVTISNTDNGVLYGSNIPVVTDFHVRLYKDAARINEVCRGVRPIASGAGTITLLEQKQSGMNGSVYWNGNVGLGGYFELTHHKKVLADPKVHTIVTTPDIEIQQVLKHIIATGKSHTVLIVGGFVIIIGKGLMTMDRKVIFDFDYPQQILPVIELNENATAHGDIELKIDDLEEITSITSVIYSCNPPSSTNDNWQGVGNDIYTSSILNVTSQRLSTGRHKLHFIFDPSAITGIGDGQFYAVIIKVNSADDATIPQAGIEMIMKINNNIAIP